MRNFEAEIVKIVLLNEGWVVLVDSCVKNVIYFDRKLQVSIAKHPVNKCASRTYDSSNKIFIVIR